MQFPVFCTGIEECFLGLLHNIVLESTMAEKLMVHSVQTMAVPSLCQARQNTVPVPVNVPVKCSACEEECIFTCLHVPYMSLCTFIRLYVPSYVLIYFPTFLSIFRSPRTHTTCSMNTPNSDVTLCH